MALLPQVPRRIAVTEAPQSSVSGADVARIFQPFAAGLEGFAETAARHADELKRAGDAATYARSSQMIREQALKIGIAANGDAEAFKSQWAAFGESFLQAQNIPEHMRGAVEADLINTGGQQYRTIFSGTYDRGIASSKATIQAEIDAQDDILSGMARGGQVGTPEWDAARAKLTGLYGQLTSNPAFGVPQGVVDVQLRRVESRYQGEATVGNIERIYRSQGMAAAQAAAEGILTDEKLTLTPAERRQYASLATAQLNALDAERTAAAKVEIDAARQMEARLTADARMVPDADVDAQVQKLLAIGGADAVTAALGLMRQRANQRFLTSFGGMTDAEQVQQYQGAAAAARGPTTVSDADATAYLIPRLVGHGRDHIDNMQPETRQRLAALFRAAPPGIREGLGIFSGARTSARQEQLWSAKVAEVARANPGLSRAAVEEIADNTVARPGGSAHEHGTGADLSYNGQSLARAPANVVQWVHDNAAAYGLKFPLGNENWHIEVSETRGGAPAPGRIAPDPVLVTAMQSEIKQDATSLIDSLEAGLAKGYAPSVATLETLAGQVSIIGDEDFTDRLTTFLQTYQSGALLANVPPDQVEGMMAQFRATMGQDGYSPAERAFIDGLSAMTAHRSAMRDENPYALGLAKGLYDPEPFEATAAPNVMAEQLGRRSMQLAALSATEGGRTFGALQPQEGAALGRRWQTATLADRVGIVGALAGSLDRDTLMKTLEQFAGDRGTATLAAAGAIYQDNPQAAEGILRGQAIAAAEPEMVPSDDLWRSISEFALPRGVMPEDTGDGTTARRALLDVAKFRFIDLARQAGVASMKGVTADGTLNDAAIDAMDDITGGIVEYHGAYLITPEYGMKQSAFNRIMSNLTDADFAGAVTADGVPITLDTFRSTVGALGNTIRQGAILKPYAQGRYLLQFGTDDAPTFALTDSRVGRLGVSGLFVLDLRDRPEFVLPPIEALLPPVDQPVEPFVAPPAGMMGGPAAPPPTTGYSTNRRF